MRVACRTRAIMRGVVVPVAGLLEPADVERLDEAGEAHRVLDRPAAVGVHGQHEVGAGRPAGGLDPLGVLLRARARRP